MTRACSSTVTLPSSPKSKSYSVGSQPIKVSHDGGVVKRHHPSSPVKTSFKALAKSTSKAECFAQLKNLLPNAKHDENTSELALVEETIAYIAYLEGILSANNDQESGVLSTTMDMFKSMKF